MDALEEARRGDRRRRPARRGDADGPADLGRPARDRRVVRARRTRRWRSRARAPDGPGYWFPPTVLCPVDRDDRAVREEIFGPVAVVVPFRDEAEAVALANDTIYGLSGSIWTRDGAKALRVARAVETGVLSINSNTSVRVSTPFGGFKQSGYGRELGPHALDALHRGQDGLLRDLMNRLDGKVCVITGRRRRHRRRDGGAVPRRGRDGRRRRPARRLAGVDLALACDVADEDAVRDMYARAREAYGKLDVLFNNAGISPNDDASVLDTSLEAWQRVQDVNLKSRLPLLQARHPAPARRRRRLGDQHRVVRRGDGRGDVADLLHGVQGRVLALSRELGVEFAPRGRARQRAVPRPGQHAAAAGAVRQGPGEGGAPARAPADGPLRGGATRSPTPRCSSPPTSRRYITASTFLVDGGLSGAYVTPE